MSNSFADRLKTLEEQELHDLLLELVQIPSVAGSERKALDFAADYLKSQGFDAEIVGMEPDFPNVIATIGSGEPVVVLNGHLDTVPPAAEDQWNSDPFEPVSTDGRVYGLGALDMKGSCAAMMLGLRVLSEHADQLKGTVQLQLVCDEEANAVYGTPYLVELVKQGKLPKPDHIIVGEYTGLKVMTAERGSFKFLVHFHGQATHTATARAEGQNAILAAAEAIRLLDRDLDIEHPAVGRAVISVNQIWGGSHMSQVPDKCTIQVDRRMIPGETMESVMKAAGETIDTLRDQIPWLEFEVTPALDGQGKPHYSPPNVSPRDITSAEAIRKAHERVTGQPSEDFTGWFGATDARCYRYAGFDAVNYGPDGLHAHGPNEFVIVDTLKTQLSVVTHAVAELCGMKIT